MFRRCWRIPNRRGIGGHRRSSGPSLAKCCQIDSWLAEDKTRPRKQRHTAKRIFERLAMNADMMADTRLSESYGVRKSGLAGDVCSAEAGHGQADFGEALVVIGGIEQKAYFFAFDLPHSDACYIHAYPAGTPKPLDGHVHAFAFFEAVPRSVLYDNDRCLVAKIMPDGTRRAHAAVQRHAFALTSSGTVMAARGKATIRARLKAWSATDGATSWCPLSCM